MNVPITRIDSGLKKSGPFVAVATVLVGMLPLVGCQPADRFEPALESSMQVYRDRFLTATPLDGDLRTPSWIKDAASGPSLPPGVESEATEENTRSVLLVGRISAGEFDPFGKGEATFVLSQMPDEGHASDDPDHADNCPFCKRKLKNAPKAIVRLESDDQTVLPIGADHLLGLSKDDVVIVQGKARYDETLNSVLMSAEKVYKK